jgi:glucose repression mediator protein
LYTGKLAEQMNDTERALHSFECVLRHNHYNVKALAQIASIYRSKDQYGRAVEYYHRALNIEGDNYEIWGALGHCFLMMDDLQKAYAAYHQAIYHAKQQNKTKQDPHLWYGIGILYERYGSLDNAEEAFTSVLKMDSSFEKSNEIYFRLGIIYKQQSKYDQSLECFGYILNNPPSPLTQADIWFQIGHVYELKKDFEEAKKSYEHVLKYNPNHAKVLQQLGWLYHQNQQFGNQDVAIGYLQRSIEADPSDGQTWYLLGRCFMAQQKYRLAYDAYQQAVFRDGRNPTFWCSIGVLYYQINQYRDALDAYSRAIRLNPYLSEVWYDLGTLYESCNQINDALDAYQRAAELDPKNKHIQQRLNMLRNPSLKPGENKSGINGNSSQPLAPINSTLEPSNSSMSAPARPGPSGPAYDGFMQSKPGQPPAPFTDRGEYGGSMQHNHLPPSQQQQGGYSSLPSMTSGPPPNPSVTLSSMSGGYSSGQPYGVPPPPSSYSNQPPYGGGPARSNAAPPPSSAQQSAMPPMSLSRNVPSPFHAGKQSSSGGGSSSYGNYPPPSHMSRQQPSPQQGPPGAYPLQHQKPSSYSGYEQGPGVYQGGHQTSPHVFPPVSSGSQQLPPHSQHHQMAPLHAQPHPSHSISSSNALGSGNDHLKRSYEQENIQNIANKRPKHTQGVIPSSMPSKRGNIDEEEDDDEMVINDEPDDNVINRNRKASTTSASPSTTGSYDPYTRRASQDDTSFLHSNSRSRFVSKKKSTFRAEPPSLAVNPGTNLAPSTNNKPIPSDSGISTDAKKDE